MVGIVVVCVDALFVCCWLCFLKVFVFLCVLACLHMHCLSMFVYGLLVACCLFVFGGCCSLSMRLCCLAFTMIRCSFRLCRWFLVMLLCMFVYGLLHVMLVCYVVLPFVLGFVVYVCLSFVFDCFVETYSCGFVYYVV